MSLEDVARRIQERRAQVVPLEPVQGPQLAPPPALEEPAPENPLAVTAKRILERRAVTAPVVAGSGDIDPIARRRSLAYAQEFELPVEAIEADLPGFEQRLKERRALRASESIRGLANELNDPSAAPAIVDDLDAVEKLDRSLRPDEPEVVPLAEYHVRRAAQGNYAVDLGIHAWRSMFGYASPEERARFDTLRRAPPREVANQWGPGTYVTGAMAEMAPIGAQVARSTAEGAVAGATVGVGAGAAVGGPAGAVAGLAPGARAGAAIGGNMSLLMIEGGNTYAQLTNIAEDLERDGYAVPEDAKIGLALGAGMLKVGLERAGLKSIGRAFPPLRRLAAAVEGSALKAVLTSASRRMAFAELGRSVVRASSREGGTEMLQEAVDVVVERSIAAAVLPGSQALLTPEDVWDRILPAGAVGAAAGGGYATVGATYDAGQQEYRRIQSSRRGLESLDRLVEDTATSKLATEAPDLFRRVFGSMSDANPLDRAVFVSPDVLEETLGAAAAGIPVVADQIATARATGGDVVIPMQDYLVDLREFHQVLRPHARVGLGALSEAEAMLAEESHGARLQAELERQGQEREGERTPLEQAHDRILDDVFEQLAQTESPEQARYDAQVAAAGFIQHALEVGRDPWELYQGVRLRIVGPSRKRVTMPTLAEFLAKDPVSGIAHTLQIVQTGQLPLKLPKFPILAILKSKGGVDPESVLAGELRNMGVTAQSMPGLYVKGGLEALDDLDLANEPIFVGNIAPTESLWDGRLEADVRLDPRALLDAIDAELRGQPLRSEEQMEAIEALAAPARELERVLEEAGVDPQQVTVAQALELLQRVGVHRPEAGELPVDQVEEPAEALPEGSATFDQPESEAFARWFGASKVVDADGLPFVVYHGTARGDRIGGRFLKKRATSGPMPFFTDDQAIATNYSTGKQDTSLEMPDDYRGWFKFKPAGSRVEVDLDRAWSYLTPQERATVLERLPTVGYQDADMAEGPIVAGSSSIAGADHIAYLLQREARGNGLIAAKELWLSSGSLFGDEVRFLEVLEGLGLGGRFRFDDPHATDPKVFAVYLSIRNPLDAAAIPPEVVEQLQQRANRVRRPSDEHGGNDPWDKRRRDPQEWMEGLRTGDGAHVWTSIPDWVTRTLVAMGYDGIRDRGGKMGGQEHTVWIPFEPTQIKSVDNRGTFDPRDPRILFQGDTAELDWQVVFHGTGAEFDRFLEDYIGTGEGTGYQGYGAYMTEALKAGKFYAKQAGRERITRLHFAPQEIRPALAPEAAAELQAAVDTVNGILPTAVPTTFANALDLVRDELQTKALSVERPFTRIRLRAPQPFSQPTDVTPRMQAVLDRALEELQHEGSVGISMGTGFPSGVQMRAISRFKAKIGRLLVEDLGIDDNLTADEADRLRDYVATGAIQVEADAAIYPIDVALERVTSLYKGGGMSADVQGGPVVLEVKIPAKSALLDWDTALEDQAAEVQAAIAGLAPLYRIVQVMDDGSREQAEFGVQEPLVFETATETDAALAALEQQHSRRLRFEMEVFEPLPEHAPEMTGKEIYLQLAAAFAGMTPEEVLHEDEQAEIFNQWGKPASLYLRAHGLKGHAYKSGHGNQNYVIYDFDAAQIQRRLFQKDPGLLAELRELQAGIQAAVAAGDTARADELRDAARKQLQQSGGPRASITLDPELQQVTIRLSARRDASSFQHELGHLFLALTLRGAEEPTASERLKADAETLRREYAIATRFAIPENAHEAFARGWEKYLAGGRAPSLALADAFARFHTWMARIYPTLQALDVDLSDEVRAIMDRLLASDQAITAARHVQGFLPAFRDALSAGMTEAEFAEYQHSAQRAFDEARRQLTVAMMADLDDRKREDYKRAVEEIGAQVTLDVDARPVMRARRWLTSGELPEGVRLDVEAKKLDRDKLVALVGDRGILRVLRPGKFGVWQKAGGHSPDVVAELFGFDSGRALVRALAETPPRRVVLEAEVTERLQARFGDVFRDGRVPELALQASIQDAQGNFLLAESRALARRIGAEPPPGPVLRRIARRIIGEQKVRELREDRYRAQEQRAGRRSVEAINARDWQTANDEKRIQVLNHYLALEARLARERADKDRAYLRRMSRPEARARMGKAGKDYQVAVDSLLYRFSFAPITKEASERRESFSKWITEQEAAGAVLVIDDKVRNEAFTQDWKGMTVAELASVADAVRSIEHNARLKNKLLASQSKREFAEHRDALVAAIRRHVGRTVKMLDPEGERLDKLRRYARYTHGAHLKLEALFKRLDGGELGLAWELLFQPFAEAEAAEQKWMRELTVELRGVFKQLRRTRATSEKVFVPEIGKSLTFERLLTMALNQGNEANKTALVEGGVLGVKLTQEQIDAILGRELTADDWKAVRAIAALVASLKEPAFALQFELTGIRPEAVEPTDVVTPHGTFPGWYWPLKADPTQSRRAFMREEKQQAQDLFQGNAFKPMTRQGHLIERTDFGEQPVWLSLSVLSEHLYNVVHDVTHRKALIQVDRLTQDAAVADAITDTVGRELHQEIRPWLKAIAGERLTSNAAWLELIAGRARHGASIAFMGLKVTVMLSQTLGALTSMGPDGVGPKRFIREVASFLVHGPLEALRRTRFALEMSPALAARRESFDREARDAIKRGVFATSRYGQWNASATKAFMYTVALMDMAVAVPTWTAAYKRGLENGATPARAVLEADSVVRLTQGSGQAKDLARVQRGGELERMFTAFYSAFSALYAQGALSITAIRDGRVSPAEAFQAALFLWILPAWLDDLITGQGPDDDEDWLTWAMLELIEYPLSLPVLVRDFGQDAFNLARGEFADFTVPFFDVLATSMRALVLPLQDLASEEGELGRGHARDLVETIGFWGQLPSRQAWITGEALYDLWTEQGDVQLPRDLFFARPPERRAQ